MNIESILRKTVSYEDWVIERLQDDQEIELYIEACLDVFREDKDLSGLLSALELIYRAQKKDDLRPLLPVVGLGHPPALLASLPGSDDLPLDQLLNWSTSVSGETLTHPNQLNPTDHHISSPESDETRRDNTGIDSFGIQYLSVETLLDFNMLDLTMPEKDKTLEYQ